MGQKHWHRVGVVSAMRGWGGAVAAGGGPTHTHFFYLAERQIIGSSRAEDFKMKQKYSKWCSPRQQQVDASAIEFDIFIYMII